MLWQIGHCNCVVVMVDFFFQAGRFSAITRRMTWWVLCKNRKRIVQRRFRVVLLSV
jgi:hypothetical protein